MPISAITETYDTYWSTLNPSQTTGSTVSEPQEEVGIKSGSILENSLEKLFGFQPKQKGRITIDELLEQGTRQLDEFNRVIKRLFYENDIDTSLPIELGSQYGTGETIVTNNHPDKEKIDQIFREHPEMSNNFKRISNMLEMAELGKESTKFQQAYRQNPQQAVEQYGYLFNTKLTSTILLEDGQAQILFERIPKTSASSVMGYQQTTLSGLAFETEI
jgi:hypothetical protein